MGEYAEMMLDGTCCACCGEYMGLDTGFPVHCAGCAPDFKVQPFTGLPIERKPRQRGGTGPKPKPCVCGDCGKSFKSKGARRHHRRRVHPFHAAPPASPLPDAQSPALGVGAGGKVSL